MKTVQADLLEFAREEGYKGQKFIHVRPVKFLIGQKEFDFGHELFLEFLENLFIGIILNPRRNYTLNLITI